MAKKILLLTVIMAASSCAALAADIDGKWTAQVQGRQGTQTQTLTLMSSGNTLTGSLEGARGAADISDGTIDGKNVSFKVVREFNGNQFTQQYKGTLSSASELKLTVSGGRAGQGGRGGGQGGFGGGQGGYGGRGGRGGQREMVFKKVTS
jgi:hypothetical protein